MDRVWERSSDYGGLLTPLVASDGRSKGGGGSGSGVGMQNIHPMSGYLSRLDTAQQSLIEFGNDKNERRRQAKFVPGVHAHETQTENPYHLRQPWAQMKAGATTPNEGVVWRLLVQHRRRGVAQGNSFHSVNDEQPIYTEHQM
ncbi:hypothetical protein PILCRDRAFT_87395 [Piloderma croceum F 1598]|uniref:Uncharacterized protein n=1 Tax=Piloderma croceum (strain F 1598) TaxID=765440 RepID=A0A0C3C497_PILCF|nr:hypothetical protein PILCRDRAFT_87395 [Piloderma croceum F 1598]